MFHEIATQLQVKHRYYTKSAKMRKERFQEPENVLKEVVRSWNGYQQWTSKPTPCKILADYRIIKVKHLNEIGRFTRKR